MANDAPKKIGGEYGDVRANIDEAKLNAYLLKNIPIMKGPIDVKQFKVRAIVLLGEGPELIFPSILVRTSEFQ